MRQRRTGGGSSDGPRRFGEPRPAPPLDRAAGYTGYGPGDPEWEANKVKRLSKKRNEDANNRMIAGLIATLVFAVVVAAFFGTWIAWWRGTFDSFLEPMGMGSGYAERMAARAQKAGGGASGPAEIRGLLEPFDGRMFTAEELATYKTNPIMLGVLGQVFDVTSGATHYGPEGGYAFFAGRDASAAFVTGKFSGEGLTDDVSELSPVQLLDVEDWVGFYHKNYKFAGRLVGRYYDAAGKPTAFMSATEARLQEGRRMRREEDAEAKVFPGCNSRWAQGQGGEVWCSQDSAGIHRDWVGVPRKFYRGAGAEAPRCVCVSADKLGDGRLKEYPNCEPDSPSCRIPET